MLFLFIKKKDATKVIFPRISFMAMATCQICRISLNFKEFSKMETEKTEFTKIRKLNTKESCPITNLKAREKSNLNQRETFMKVSFTEVKCMVKEKSPTKTEISMKANFKMDFIMGREYTVGDKDKYLKEVTKREKNMDSVP